MRIIFILIMPLLLTALTAICLLFFKNHPDQSEPNRHSVNKINALGYLISLGYFTSLVLVFTLVWQGTINNCPRWLWNIFYVDALGLFFMLAITIVTFATALYSQGFLQQALLRQDMPVKKALLYYLLFNLFIFSMLLVTTVDNLGMLWVAMEISTLVSTFLVGFYNTKNSVEAAWKYIIICSVGILLALLGTILFSYTLLFSTGIKSLSWNQLNAVASSLNVNMVKMAFIFIMVGYGTKAGLAPMHTWLPDAHSQAVSPISALLSGLLLKTALFAILKFGIIVAKSAGYPFLENLFLSFGLLSLAVAAGLTIVQKDIKRLLAYSSIEHIGLIAFGFGLGSPIGLYGALLHILNHAATKAFLFFGAGNITSIFHRYKISQLRGVLTVMPFTGIMFLLGLFAIAGFPPFSIFRSEMLLLIAAFLKGAYLPVFFVLFCIISVFSATIYHFSPMLFSKKPENIAVQSEPWSIKLAFLFLLVFMCALGLVIPKPLDHLIVSIINIFNL